MTPKLRVLVTLVAAAAFGFAAGLFKGDDAALRAGIGNLSAPWVLVALLPGTRAKSLSKGAATGLACTGVALAGFYAALTGALAGQLGGGGFLHEVVVEVGANRIYFLFGTFTGPLVGVIGAWIGLHHPTRVRLVVGALVAGELPIVALVEGRQLLPAPIHFAWGVSDWTPYLAEFTLGVALLTEGIRHYRQTRPSLL